jgi:hypothetical protein
MEAMSFSSTSWQVLPFAGGAREMTVNTLVGSADARALADALSWQRAQDHLATAMETVEGILALRELIGTHDTMEAVGTSEHGGPVTLTMPQVALLAEAAARYVASRDHEGHQPLEDRERSERLRHLAGPLFELVGSFARHEREAHDGCPGV